MVKNNLSKKEILNKINLLDLDKKTFTCVLYLSKNKDLTYGFRIENRNESDFA